jgi:hypothetical protein
MAGGACDSLGSKNWTSELVGGIDVKSNLSGDFLLGAVGGGRFPAARTGALTGGRVNALTIFGAARAAAMVAVKLDAEAAVLCGGRLGSLSWSGDVRLLTGPSLRAIEWLEAERPFCCCLSVDAGGDDCLIEAGGGDGLIEAGGGECLLR